ncbi:WD40 repeat-like protein [Irpex rosettiformis]|uniref:WD40 repeat-like protein n=1 Tax=Irpex rosettiformis TaxID=378272 RepID=A0ACB8TRJ0_9APHY|nr:WD40 repeat-like protein [Irpex rosettiformis]
MVQTGLIPNAHNDLVTDAAYDFYGLRLATCSLDQRIKVWQLDERDGTWSVEDDWKAHDAAITKVSWAHPEFGTIIASSSFDRTVKVWEQTSYSDADPQHNGASSSSSSSRWVERAVLVDARSTVRAVDFAPPSFGLKLATISSDNYLRIYECFEQPSLTTWQMSEEVDVVALPTATPGGLSQTAPLLTPTQTQAGLDSASLSLAGHIASQQQQQGQIPSRPGLGNREASDIFTYHIIVRSSPSIPQADGGWCISWCKDRYWGELIAAGCGINGVIIQLSPSRRPSNVLSLDASPQPRPTGPDATPRSPAVGGDTDAPTPYSISSVSWAPSCGRSYHLIATGSRDGHVRIWRVKSPIPPDELDEDDIEIDEGAWSATIVGDFDDHKSAVGRVEWNITGTILSSAGNDGRVRLWKATAGNVWRPAGHISVEQADEQRPDVDMDENVVAD